MSRDVHKCLQSAVDLSTVIDDARPMATNQATLSKEAQFEEITS